MAQVFTTTFQYNNQEYTALVSESDTSLTITLQDGSMKLVLPQDALPPRNKDAFVAGAQNLVAALLAAVEARQKEEQDEPLHRIGGGEGGNA